MVIGIVYLVVSLHCALFAVFFGAKVVVIPYCQVLAVVANDR